MEDNSKTEISPWPWSWEFSRNVFGQPKYIGETYANDAYCILDRDGFIASEVIANWTQCVAEKNISLMAAAPELREELEKLVKRSCSMCAAETKASVTPTRKPCEDGKQCPYGLDGAKKAIAKSYGKEN